MIPGAIILECAVPTGQYELVPASVGSLHPLSNRIQILLDWFDHLRTTQRDLNYGKSQVIKEPSILKLKYIWITGSGEDLQLNHGGRLVRYPAVLHGDGNGGKKEGHAAPEPHVARGLLPRSRRCADRLVSRLRPLLLLLRLRGGRCG